MVKQAIKYVCCAMLPLVSIVVVVCVSWGLATLIDIHTNNLTVKKYFNHLPHKEHEVLPNPPYPGHTMDNIFWFVQISDIHISKFRSYNQVEDLKEFCSTTLNIIQPSLLLITGDLTDAKDIHSTGSMQYKEEWMAYADVLAVCQSLSYKIIDVRGNHDTFDVPHDTHKKNLYRDYGASAATYRSGVYQYVHHTSFGSYSFNGIDLAPSPGPGRPFNFFAIPRKETLEAISRMTNNANNGTVWFGHYPLSITTAPHHLRRLLSSGVVYLCGHLHTFVMGMFPRMYALHQEGFMELELGDWKLNRRFRVGVFDHDVFSFNDFTFHVSAQQPIIIHTNPVDARFVVSNTTLHKGKHSSHIRFLMFASSPIPHTSVHVDGELVCAQVSCISSLCLCQWNASKYSEGVHTLLIRATLNDNSVHSSEISFSFDTRLPLNMRNIIMLITDFRTMLRSVFVAAVMATVVSPLLLRIAPHQKVVGPFHDLISMVFPQVIAFVRSDHFWTLFFFNCYICIGPLSFGHYLTDSYGVMFSFGIYTKGGLLQGTLTFAYVAVHLFVLTPFLMLYVGDVITRQSKPLACFTRTLLALFAFFELCSYVLFHLAYGWLAAVSNPLHMVPLPLLVYLSRKMATKI